MVVSGAWYNWVTLHIKGNLIRYAANTLLRPGTTPPGRCMCETGDCMPNRYSYKWVTNTHKGTNNHSDTCNRPGTCNIRWTSYSICCTLYDQMPYSQVNCSGNVIQADN